MNKLGVLNILSLISFQENGRRKSMNCGDICSRKILYIKLLAMLLDNPGE